MHAVIDHKAIGKRVRALRTQRHWNQTRLAAQLGIKQNTLSDIERGVSPLSLEQAGKVCKLFGVNSEWLLFHDEG